jgi:MerR family copper efflux transcriptional regulator
MMPLDGVIGTASRSAHDEVVGATRSMRVHAPARWQTGGMSDRLENPLVASPIGNTMTIGELSKRTGVPVEQLRRYEDLGFIYTVGRSAGNYRLFDESAEWCVGVVSRWRTLGLTLSEIGELIHHYLDRRDENIGPRVAGYLQRVRRRTQSSIAELTELLDRLDAFEAEHGAELSGRADFRSADPRFGGSGA